MIFSTLFGNRRNANAAGTTTGSTLMSTRRTTGTGAQPRNGATTPALAPGASGAAIGDARRPSASAVTVGTAVPRNQANATPPAPDATAASSNASGSARAAGLRARRKGAGSSVLSGLPVTGGGAARVRTRTLLGY
jgi:hypothetical protein